MRKILSMLSLILLSQLGYAQITITTADMPDIDDTFRYTNATFLFEDFTATGAAHTWDYSALLPQSQMVRKFERAVDVNPLYIFFGLSAYGEKTSDTIDLLGILTIENIYDFYENSASTFKASGRGIQIFGAGIPNFYSDDDEIYKFPLDYNDIDTTGFAVSFSIPGVGTLSQKGDRITEADGWGLLITPYTTYSQVLRVKSTLLEEDSIYVDALSFGFTLPRTIIQYRWLTHDENIDVMTVSGDEIFGFFAPSTVRYRDIYREVASPFGTKAGFYADQTSVNVGETVNFTDTSTNFPFSWSWNISPSTHNYVGGSGSGDQNPSVNFSAAGLYTVSLDATNLANTDNETKTDYIEVKDTATAISPIEIAQSIELYPNPVKDVIQLKLGKNILDEIEGIEISDSKGSVVEVLTYSKESNILIESTGLSSGTYFIKLNLTEGRHAYKKFVKE